MDLDLLNQLRNVPLSDKDAHTRLVMAMQVNSAIKRQLWMMVQDGVSAVNEINLRGRRID